MFALVALLPVPRKQFRFSGILHTRRWAGRYAGNDHNDVLGCAARDGRESRSGGQPRRPAGGPLGRWLAMHFLNGSVIFALIYALVGFLTSAGRTSSPGYHVRRRALADAAASGNADDWRGRVQFQNRLSLPWKLTTGEVDGARRGHMDAVFNGPPERDWPAYRPHRGLRALSMGDFDGCLSERCYAV